MRFMMLVKADPRSETGAMPDERTIADMLRYNEELSRAGLLLAAEALHASSQGVRVHYREGKFTVMDGPFTESKDLVAGFWLIRAKSREEAIEWAKKVPFEEGEVEVRPLFELEDFPVDPAEDPGGWREREEQFRESSPPPRRPGTARYLGMVMADEASEAGVLPDEKLLAAMGAFFEEGIGAGVILGGEGLQPSSKAVRVRYAGKKREVIDGPFTESKEIIAGYALLQFASKDEAIDWTKRFLRVDAPGRHLGEAWSEIRPILDDDGACHGAAGERRADAARGRLSSS
jgi:hypothetical protein